MSWGRSTSETRPSVFSKLIPLVITLAIFSGIAFVCYQIYLSATIIRKNAKDSMGKKNVVMTRDGVRVGVKSIKNEKYVDNTQSWVVKAWRAATPGSGSDPAESKKK